MTGSRWLTRVAGGHGTRLVCVPHAGAGSLAYRSWAPYLKSAGEFLVAVLPGRDHRLREPPARCAAEVIGPLGAAIAAVPRPLLLFGHSMGALLAFGVARRLRDEGFPEPLAVVVSGSHPPGLTRPGDESDLPDDDALTALVRRLGGTPESALENPALRRHVLGLLRADFELARSAAVDSGSVSCPLVAMRARGDSRVSGAGVREWGRHSSSLFRYVEHDGDHFAPVNDAPAFVRTMENALEEINRERRTEAC